MGSVLIDPGKDQRGTLQGLLGLAININERASVVNEKLQREVGRIGGSWPVQSSDPEGGPDTDGLIASIEAVLVSVNRKIGDAEEVARRLSSI
jgi:hypothetical protein